MSNYINTPKIRRIYVRDLMNLFSDPPFGLFAVNDEGDMRFIHVIIMGVMDTPYEGGFFYFILKCPSDYPMKPPKVRLMTTDAGRVRFNPNMYQNGKVCLSILGTWDGPPWSPAQHLTSVLLSIQSLMNENPYFNEPHITETCPGDAKRYAEMIRHETLRVAVCGMLENECNLNMPRELRTIMEKTFMQFFDQYVETATKHLNLDLQSMPAQYSRRNSKFNYSNILTRLNTLYTNLAEKYADILPELEAIGNGDTPSASKPSESNNSSK